MSLGTNDPGGMTRSTTGCLPPLMSMPRVSASSGRDVPVPGGGLGQAGECVHVGHGVPQGRNPVAPSGDLGAHLPVEGPLQLLDPLPGVEYQGLVLLQLRRDEPLASHQRLAPGVVVGHLGQVGVADLDVVAEDLVVSDLEAPYAGALPLPVLEPRDVLAGVPGGQAQLVQLGGEPLPDDAPVPRLPRRARAPGRRLSGPTGRRRAACRAPGGPGLRRRPGRGGPAAPPRSPAPPSGRPGPWGAPLPRRTRFRARSRSGMVERRDLARSLSRTSS